MRSLFFEFLLSKLVKENIKRERTAEKEKFLKKFSPQRNFFCAQVDTINCGSHKLNMLYVAVLFQNVPIWCKK